MPWKECSAVEERLRLVARLLEGESMTDLRREFGISRKTGYKIFDRYKEHGLEALADRSRRPVRYANQLPAQVESLIVSLKRDKPHWGARKIRELLVRRLDGHVRLPAKSTIHAVLDRHGLVKAPGPQAQPRHRDRPLRGSAPNDLWCAHYKGEFKLGTGRYCHPLTVTTRLPASCCSAKPSNPPGKTSPLPPSPALCRARPAKSPPLRQRRPLRQPQMPSSTSPSSGLAVPARHRHRAHQARSPAAERTTHERMHLTLTKEGTCLPA